MVVGDQDQIGRWGTIIQLPGIDINREIIRIDAKTGMGQPMDIFRELIHLFSFRNSYLHLD
jgi:hypothetical protein